MKYILRAAIAIIAGILALDALVLVGRGVLLSWHAYSNLFDPLVDKPLLPALEAVDLFFMALVFLIMAIGLVQLFIGDLSMMKSLSFSWLKIDSFTALKILLWDTFLVTLLVLFVTKVFAEPVMEWEILILPAAILMLTVCSFLLKRKH
jgi:uncharacterized membrane protein YqhA